MNKNRNKSGFDIAFKWLKHEYYDIYKRFENVRQKGLRAQKRNYMCALRDNKGKGLGINRLCELKIRQKKHDKRRLYVTSGKRQLTRGLKGFLYQLNKEEQKNDKRGAEK